jgi:hypothetical protein
MSDFRLTHQELSHVAGNLWAQLIDLVGEPWVSICPVILSHDLIQASHVSQDLG